MKLLISACLLGIPCRYDGASKPQSWAEKLAERHELVPVCPEQLGGLPTPRHPSERQGERVVMDTGADVTEPYSRGAEAALRLCRLLQPILRLRDDIRRNFYRHIDGRRRGNGGTAASKRDPGAGRKSGGNAAVRRVPV